MTERRPEGVRAERIRRYATKSGVDTADKTPEEILEELQAIIACLEEVDTEQQLPGLQQFMYFKRLLGGEAPTEVANELGLSREAVAMGAEKFAIALGKVGVVQAFAGGKVTAAMIGVLPVGRQRQGQTVTGPSAAAWGAESAVDPGFAAMLARDMERRAVIDRGLQPDETQADTIRETVTAMNKTARISGERALGLILLLRGVKVGPHADRVKIDNLLKQTEQDICARVINKQGNVSGGVKLLALLAGQDIEEGQFAQKNKAMSHEELLQWHLKLYPDKRGVEEIYQDILGRVLGGVEELYPER